MKWRHASEQNVHSLKKSLHELRTLQQSEDLSDELRARVELSISRIENGLEYYLWLSRLIDAFESHDIFQFVPKKESDS